MRLTDSSGHFWETVADVVSVGYDVYDIYQNGLTWSSGGALVVDVAGAAIPFVPSAGTCVRWCDDAWQYGSKAVGWVGDKADEGWQAAKNLVGMGDEAAQYGDEAASAAKAGADCLTNSFSAETLVMTPSGAKPIAELTEGDLVLAYNEATGKIGAYPIIDTISHIDPEIVLLTIDGETLETTAEHPFYELQSAPWLAAGQTEGRWTNALELKAGDLVWKADGTSNAVQSVEVAQVPQRMYNLTVAEAHTFFVGKQQWLVHNCDFSVVRYGDKVSGANNHHGIMDAWASANVPGYVSRASGAPTVQMSTEAHAKTTAVFRQWLTENYGNPVGVKVDWSKHSRQEIYNLAERMFDAAGTPHAVRTRYYTALDSYLQTGKWE